MAHAPDPQVPRLVFVNKLDRVGANPFRVIQQARDKLRLNAAAVQVRGRAAGAGGWGRVCVWGQVWACPVERADQAGARGAAPSRGGGPLIAAHIPCH